MDLFYFSSLFSLPFKIIDESLLLCVESYFVVLLVLLVCLMALQFGVGMHHIVDRYVDPNHSKKTGDSQLLFIYTYIHKWISLSSWVYILINDTITCHAVKEGYPSTNFNFHTHLIVLCLVMSIAGILLVIVFKFLIFHVYLSEC